MTPKHTPGPWTIVGKTRDAIRGPAGNIVAECIGYSDKATDPVQRAYGGRESNARLIARCPEMYDMLRRILETVEMGESFADNDFYGSDVAALRGLVDSIKSFPKS